MAQQPIVKNAANEEELKEASQKKRFAEQRTDNAWKAVMATDHGMQVLMDIFAFCKLESCPLEAGGSDRDIFTRLGRQKVGRFLKVQMINADRRKYFETELKLGEETK